MPRASIKVTASSKKAETYQGSESDISVERLDPAKQGCRFGTGDPPFHLRMCLRRFAPEHSLS